MGTDQMKETSEQLVESSKQSFIEIHPLTGLYFSNTFGQKVEEYLAQVKEETYCMVAIDFEHFRLFNKLFGREQGDCLLKSVADLLKEFVKKYGGVVGYFWGDNFGVLMPYEENLINQLYSELSMEVKKWNNVAGFLPIFGVCPIIDTTVPAATLYDRATIALSSIVGNHTKRICEYVSDMEAKVEEEVQILAEVQGALENDEFTFFVQPQCDISTGKIVGGESLVRWMHKEKGMIPPGKFIPVLERNGFIANLDRQVWRKVCQWLREWLDKGHHPVPISINVSRIDIFSMDVAEYLSELIDTYNLPKRLLKVEITESAYAENNDQIIRTVKQLRDADFLVMMDDFGSGYSSLNMLNSLAIDVLKIDMRFLDISEEEEEKGIGILESVVNMARQIQMPIIVEGVETKKQESFLLKMGCRYSQGYYYYKPMSIKDFEELISDEKKLDMNGIWWKQVESLRLREFLDRNLFTDTMLNNILGAAAFYDMFENKIEITRVNEQYNKLAGINNLEENSYNKRFWNHVQHDDQAILFSMFSQAYENPSMGSNGYLHYVRSDGEVLWIYFRVYFLREKDGHKLFYGSLTDMTSFQKKKSEEIKVDVEVEEFTEIQRDQIEKFYGNMPCGYAIGKIILDSEGKPNGYEIVYANKELDRISCGNTERLYYLLLKLFSDNGEEVLEKAYRAAYLGEKIEHQCYSSISSRYLELTFYQYQHGYVSCMIQDMTKFQIYEKAMKNILYSFREVYFIHLQDNYWRMVYPDENHLLERGNYQEAINRHFVTGKILPYEEDRIREFLSLENLREKLLKEDTIEHKYRRSVNGVGEEWCMTTINVSERKEDGTPKTAIMTIRSIEALVREKEMKKRHTMTELLTTMSDGFLVYKAEEGEQILHVNPPLLQIYGCDTIEEFRELVSNSFRGMVYPEDLERVEWEIEEQVTHSDRKMDYIRYRIIRKDGSIRWVDDCGHLEDMDKTSKVFYVFLSDITDSISQEEIDKIEQLNQQFKESK